MNALQDPLPLDLAPMEAEAVDELPSGGGWRVQAEVRRLPLHRSPSRGRTLTCNPGMASRSRATSPRSGGEILEGGGRGRLCARRGARDPGRVAFEALQLRLHPAESRIRLALAAVAGHGTSPSTFSLAAGLRCSTGRCANVGGELESLSSRGLAGALGAPARGRDRGRSGGPGRWLGGEGPGRIVAKRLDLATCRASARRVTFKVWTTVDCVVVGLYGKGDILRPWNICSLASTTRKAS